MSQLAATRTVLISELATALGADTLTAKEGSPLHGFIQRTAEAIVAQSVENAALRAEKTALVNEIKALREACKPVCDWWVKFKDQYPQFSFGDIDSSTFDQRTITVSATDLDTLSRLVLPVDDMRGTGIVKHEPGCNHFLPSGKCDCGALG